MLTFHGNNTCTDSNITMLLCVRLPIIMPHAAMYKCINANLYGEQILQDDHILQVYQTHTLLLSLELIC